MSTPPAPVPGARPRRRLSTDVLVVGAGPTGLMAGAWCARLGVQALVVDGKAGPTRESRALALQARSLEVYRQLGLAQEVLARAHPAATVSPGYRHRTLGTVPLERLGHALTPFSGLTVFEQSANEQLLVEYLRERRRPVAWGASFRGFSETPPSSPRPVTVDLDSPEGPVQVTARYVVAADGAASPVRSALGIGFEGATNRFEFYVLDAHGVTGTASGITLRTSREHFMLAFPMGDDGRGGQRARLLGILRAEERSGATGTMPSDAHDEARARASLAEEFGIHYAGTDWYSTYRVHHRVAAAFRSGGAGGARGAGGTGGSGSTGGRVFLAGDAAHIHSPVGAQGMNTGLQDAQNIVCKIADVLAGRAPEESLGRYEAERRPVALNLVRTTDVVFGAVTSATRGARFLRTVVFPALAPVVLRLIPRSPAGGRLFGYLSQIRIHYWMPGTEAQQASRGLRRRGRVLGRRLPWVPDAGPSGSRAREHTSERAGAVPHGDNHEALNAATWQVHAYGPAAAATARELAARHRKTSRTRLRPVRGTGGPNGTMLSGDSAAGGEGPSSGMGSGVPVFTFRAAPEAGLPDGTAVLVRPDGFVAALDTSATPPPTTGGLPLSPR